MKQTVVQIHAGRRISLLAWPTLLRLGLPVVAFAWLTLSCWAQSIPLPMAEFKLDEGAIDPSTNTIYSADGAFTGTLSGTNPQLWITNLSALSPLLLAQTNTVAALTNTVTGSAGGGYVLTTFYGTNNSGASILGTNARTVCVWIQAAPGAPVTTQYIITYGSVSSTVGGRFSIRLETAAGYVGGLRCEVSTGSVTGTNTAITDGKWHHLAVVSPGGGYVSNLLLYVDGNLQKNALVGTPTTLLNTATNNPVWIGGYTPLSGNDTFLGAIDDVQFYNQALTQAQIAGLVYGPGNPPGIVQQPSPATVILGSTNGNASFSVAVSGSPTMRYTWKKNGVAIPGATNQSFSIQPVQSTDLAAYSVGITNSYGGTNSAPAALAWSAPAPDPLEQTVLVGGTAKFTVTMPTDSTGYTYQWLQGAAPIGGATSASYTLANATLASATNYSVAVTLSGQTATSAPVQLNVLPAPASPYAALVLADMPSAYWRLGENNGASVAADVTGFHSGYYSNFQGSELQQPGALTSDADTASSFTGTVWVKVPYAPALEHTSAFSVEAWVNPNSTSGLEDFIDACSDSASTHGYELAVNGTSWLFRTGNSLITSGAAYTDLNGGTVTAGVWQHVVGTFDGTNKNLYVNGALVGTQATTVLPAPVSLYLGAGLPNNVTPGQYFNGTMDEPAVYWEPLTPMQVLNHYLMGLAGPGVAASIPTQPQPVQAVLGSTNAASFSVGIFGTPYFTFQWMSNGVSLSGQTNIALTIANAGTAGQANYSVAVTNGLSGLISSKAALTYITTPITPGGLALPPGGSGSFSIAMPAYQNYTYQWQHAGTNVPGASGPSLALNNVTLANGGNYAVVVTLGSVSVTSAPVALAVLAAPAMTYSNTIAGDGPVAWWRLDDAPNSATIADVYGNNPGVVSSQHNDVIFGVAGALLGDSDTAAYFTGYSSGTRANAAKIEVNNNSLLNNPTFSVELWALVTGGEGTTRSPLTSRASSTGVANGYAFYAGADNNWQFQLGTGTNFLTVEGSPVAENQWAHLVGTYDGANAAFYVNGALIWSGATAFVPDSTTVLRLGAGATESTTGSFYYPGRLDEVAVYTNALTQAQVQGHYAAAFPANAAPRFTQQSASHAALIGASQTLSATVYDVQPLKLQWQLNDTNLVGATNATLTLNPVSQASAGVYQLTAQSGTSGATNVPVTLAVLTGQAVSGNLLGNDDTNTIASHGGIAGYVTATNWNEFGYAADTGSVSNLINQAGQNTGIIASWAANNYRYWGGPLPAAGGDYALLNGFLEATNTGSLTLTLTDIPAKFQSAGYSLYLYFGEPSGAAGLVNADDTFGAVSVGTATNYYHAIDLSQWDGNYYQATNSNPNDSSPQDANYAVFTNLSSAAVTVTVVPHPVLLAGPASLSGFQLVANVAVISPLAINKVGNNLVLSWTSGVLQSKHLLTGSWQDVSGATSPYTIPTPLTDQQYYQLR